MMKNKGKLKNKSAKILKKSKNGIVRSVFSRFGLVVLLFVLQIVLIFIGFAVFEENMPGVYAVVSAISVVMLMFLINSSMDPSAMITWILLIMAFPVFGGMLYAFVKSDIGHRALRDRIEKINRNTCDYINHHDGVLSEFRKENENAASLAGYIRSKGCHPIYRTDDVIYFSSGESKLESVLNELEKAEKYIFLEYFIIAEGVMWKKVLEILKRKAAVGLDVRIMYDGTCEFTTLPHSYPEQMKKFGIKCKPFAPITPFLSTHYNYRDHRKILVIDGKCAYTGGINFADEYINVKSKYGHWKDTAVMVKGEAAISFALMFLKMWAINEKKENYEYVHKEQLSSDRDCGGYVVPYSDCPLDGDKVGERVYVDILNRASRYVHIMTPYLILDAVTENALKFAAERGVDVSIILPGVPDKKVPYAIAMTHYKPLLEAGVKIYEYTPGFVHAKVFVSDDNEAVVGTVNLDYRSLYHHFECGLYMYNTGCIADIEKDFENTRNSCVQVTLHTIKKAKISRKILGFLMKAIAPLL